MPESDDLMISGTMLSFVMGFTCMFTFPSRRKSYRRVSRVVV